MQTLQITEGELPALINKDLTKRQLAQLIALHTEELFPHVCLDILKDVYGARLDLMVPKTIYGLVSDMMSTVADPDMEEITKTVNDYLNN